MPAGSKGIATILTRARRRSHSHSTCRKQTPAAGSEAEFAPPVGLAPPVVGADMRRRAARKHLPRVQDVGAIADAQRLAHVVIGDQHADAALLEVAHDALDLAD